MGSKEKRLPVRIQKIVGACKAGQTLCLQIKHSEVGDEKAYWLEPSSRPVGAKSAEQAIGLGLLKPCGDALFAEADSQTYRIRLALPYPPSGWDLYTGWGKKRRLSSEYAKWREDAGFFIKRNRPAICVPFSISIALKRPNKRQDIDNRSKAILDCLQHYGVIKNDNLCERLSMVWVEGMEAECIVLVQPIEEDLAA